MIKFFEKLLDYIFCKKCYLCHEYEENIVLCSKCYSKLEKNQVKIFINNETKISFYAAGIYDGNLKTLIRGLKFHYQKELANPIAKFMYEYWEQLKIKPDNYIVIAVPQYTKTKKPYNHAQEIAREFAKLTGYKYDFDLIKRIKKTKPQYKLNHQERKENLEGAFKLTKEIDKNAVYIIIDDIITTSATVEQMQKTLNSKNIVFCASMTEAYLQ